MKGNGKLPKAIVASTKPIQVLGVYVHVQGYGSYPAHHCRIYVGSVNGDIVDESMSKVPAVWEKRFI